MEPNLRGAIQIKGQFPPYLALPPGESSTCTLKRDYACHCLTSSPKQDRFGPMTSPLELASVSSHSAEAQQQESGF